MSISNQVPQDDNVTPETPEEEANGGAPAEPLQPEEIDELFGGPPAAAEPTNQVDANEAPAIATLRKDRSWGDPVAEEDQEQ